ncbi:coiled-coil-helix-coiled-coil-helix domain-containing protein 2-like [Topomyia yanbarensis]|uniref:coiled-coil-helix-coiled-coil-helix domain-containing protein 2-like n=1 Tax=Topomyia yanbarensis TaxID=2498891 RepID=UPI00273CF19E|nr:coiled-coil-helix-coiled-coil-helix domain-containing protein 2-like [Topomyia yanbarensis]XP_058839541.1 coiled-coil-helix-coiled-coil-helix domain-containing protein 2-like [Topomyia yanbarensis]
MVQPASHSAVAAPMVAPNQALGLIVQIAATAGSVAIGSVGNTVRHTLIGMFSGSYSQEAASPGQAAPVSGEANTPAGPCSWKIKQLLSCTQGQAECDS